MVAMTIRPIVRAGHPVLNRIADSVADPTDPAIAELVRDMLDTLAESGGVGLAAPQIAVPLRVVVFYVPEHRLSDHAEDRGQDMTVLINPAIEPLDGVVTPGWEGCLSIPGLRGLVPRHDRIRYTGVGLDGTAIDRTVGGFHARVVQHECDHLDGRLYPTRMADLSKLIFREEFETYVVGESHGT
jgi:peptide deformylase